MASIVIKDFPLIQKAVGRGLFSLFSQHRSQIRFVGGCVRDASLGISTHDIDLATTATPAQMVDIFTKEGIKWIPTGIDFGTITVVLAHTPFQITSLRQDWQTDGRRALVRFGTDWTEDAKRRDFTFNALYADEHGHIIDFFDGHGDLQAGIVRFIGEAEERIREDYLRILRYFRFYARFGKIPPTPELISLLSRHRDGLRRLSIERITDEVFKLLSTPHPLMALAFMNQSEIFSDIFACEWQPETVETLLAIEEAANLPLDALRRLQCLQPLLQEANLHLNLSRSHKKRYEQVMALKKDLTIDLPTTDNLYASTQDVVQDAYILRLCDAVTQNEISREEAIQATKALIAIQWEKPQFPLTGKHLLALGIKPGPRLGILHKDCEQWWIASDFKPDLKACLRWIRERDRKK